MRRAIVPIRADDKGGGRREGSSGGARPRRRLGLALAAVLLGPAAPGAETTPAAGRLSVRQEADAITVTCRGDLAWKAVVDRTHGGVVGHFSIPDDGPNLVA